MNLPARMAAGAAATLLISDGVLALVQPRRHARLWNTSYLDERPAQSALLGVAFMGLGLWLASKAVEPDEADPYADPLGADYPPIYPPEIVETMSILPVR